MKVEKNFSFLLVAFSLVMLFLQFDVCAMDHGKQSDIAPRKIMNFDFVMSEINMTPQELYRLQVNEAHTESDKIRFKELIEKCESCGIDLERMECLIQQVIDKYLEKCLFVAKDRVSLLNCKNPKCFLDEEKLSSEFKKCSIMVNGTVVIIDPITDERILHFVPNPGFTLTDITTKDEKIAIMRFFQQEQAKLLESIEPTAQPPTKNRQSKKKLGLEAAPGVDHVETQQPLAANNGGKSVVVTELTKRDISGPDCQFPVDEDSLTTRLDKRLKAIVEEFDKSAVVD